MENYMSKMENLLCKMIENEAGHSTNFRRLTSYSGKITVAGNHEMYLDKVVSKFTEETGIAFNSFQAIHDGECRTTLYFEYPNKEQFYLAELEKASRIIENYNNMYGEGSWNTDEDVKHFNELTDGLRQ